MEVFFPFRKMAILGEKTAEQEELNNAFALGSLKKNDHALITKCTQHVLQPF